MNKLFIGIIVCTLLSLTLSNAWYYEKDFDEGVPNERAVGSDGFDGVAGQSYYNNQIFYEGGQSAQLNAQRGKSGFGKWGGSFNFENLHKGDEFWFQIKTYFPENFDYSASPRLKFLRLHTAKEDNSNAGYNDIYINPPNSQDAPFMGIKEGHNQWFRFGNSSHKIQKGTWETYEVYIKLDNTSQEDGGEGVMRFYKDNELLGEFSEIETLGTADHYANYFYLFTYWNSGPFTRNYISSDNTGLDFIDGEQVEVNNKSTSFIVSELRDEENLLVYATKRGKAPLNISVGDVIKGTQSGAEFSVENILMKYPSQDQSMYVDDIIYTNERPDNQDSQGNYFIGDYNNSVSQNQSSITPLENFTCSNIYTLNTSPIFCDDFETGDLSSTSNNFSWSSSAWAGVSSDNSFGGNHSLFFNFRGNGILDIGDSWAEQRFNLGKEYKELWFKYDLYLPSNYHQRTAAYFKIDSLEGEFNVGDVFYRENGNPQDYGVINYVNETHLYFEGYLSNYNFYQQLPFNIYSESGGTARVISKHVRTSNDKGLVFLWNHDYSGLAHTGFNFRGSRINQTQGNAALTITRKRDGNSLGHRSDPNGELVFDTSKDLGKWHEFVMRIKLADPNNSNGVAQVWKNGEIIFNLTDVENWHSTENFLDKGYLLGWANGGFYEDTPIYIDNFLMSSNSLLDFSRYSNGSYFSSNYTSNTSFENESSDDSQTINESETPNSTSQDFSCVDIYSNDPNIFFCDGFETGDIRSTNNGNFDWKNMMRTSIVTMDDEGPVAVYNNGDIFNRPSSYKNWTSLSGNYSMRFRYPAGQPMAEQRFDFNGNGYEELWWSFWVRVPHNFKHGTANNKLFRLWMDGYSQNGEGSTVGMSFRPNGAGGSNFFAKIGSGDFSGVGGDTGSVSFIETPQDNGKWMNLMVHVKSETQPGAQDGVMEVWRKWENDLEYSKTHNLKDLPVKLDSTVGGFQEGYLMGWANGAYENETEWLIDNVVFSNSSLLYLFNQTYLEENTSPETNTTTPTNTTTDEDTSPDDDDGSPSQDDDSNDNSGGGSSGGSSGGGGSSSSSSQDDVESDEDESSQESYVAPVCQSDFSYSAWSSCVNGTQFRIVTDENTCVDSTQETRVCEVGADENELKELNAKEVQLAKINNRRYETSFSDSYNEMVFTNEKLEDETFVVVDSTTKQQYLGTLVDQKQGKYYYTLDRIDQNNLNTLKEQGLAERSFTESASSVFEEFKNSRNFFSVLVILSLFGITTVIYVISRYMKKLHRKSTFE